MPQSFYENPEYKLKQSSITKRNWEIGKFDSLKKPFEDKNCANADCRNVFKVKPGNPKKYCGHICSAKAQGGHNSSFMSKKELKKLYLSGMSLSELAQNQNTSVHKIVYWMNKYRIERRTISDAVYLKNHPNGDPFKFIRPHNLEGAKLFGLGVGLYWGEGNKANKTSIRLGNTDPNLINTFIKFLAEIFSVKKEDLVFGLQIFTDIDTNEAIDYWIKKLGIKRDQLYKPIITKSGSLGTYRKKSQFGVIMLNYHNRKLRDILVGLLPT